ncbi:unnamed protein product [Linum trigynum]|uniref:Uncharacterized protein n=1 Tax=Linum trigynum TaxID=586398 RepID=A0AAV2GF34_9ROSI
MACQFFMKVEQSTCLRKHENAAVFCPNRPWEGQMLLRMEISHIDDDIEMALEAVTGEAGGQLEAEMASTVPPNGLVEKNACIPGTGIESVRNEAADEDQPLSMWFGRLCSSKSADGLRVRQADQETNPDVWPFQKRSPAWASIESLEVFRNIPQKPHFRPLFDCKEDYREGAAIGIMVTFSNVFEKIANLRIHDSRASFKSNLASLSDLEKHGFNVTLPRNRINKLLSIKEPLSKWMNVVKNAEPELQHHIDKKRKLVATIDEIEKKMLELQQTLAATKKVMEAEEAKAAVLQSTVDEMKDRIDSACNEFELVVAAPWR